MPDVLVERITPGTALVTLNRPDTLNAFTLTMLSEFMEVLDSIASDDTCRVVVITGRGRGFCSGRDLSDVGDSISAPERMAMMEAVAGLAIRLRSLPQPVIAAVNGPASGGGLALALAADIRICTQSARFNVAFVRIGLSGCDAGVSYLLPRIVSPTVAFEMMLTGRFVDADEAHRVGLVLRVVRDGEAVPAALEIAEHISANTPFGIRQTKQVMWTNLDAPSLAAAIELENRTQVICAGTLDHSEAVAAFVERRAPNPKPFCNK